jgi:thiamine biosynthesis lipoprotein
VTADCTSRSEILLGTVVTVTIVQPAGAEGASSAIDRAFRWFRDVEACCSRFDSESELMQLTRHVGFAVKASDLLFEAVRFALAVAEETDGAFDPTMGHVMEGLGFNREHRTGVVIATDLKAPDDVSFRDVVCDADAKTVTLMRPLILDLGAVAKGLAIDMAVRELLPFRDFAIDAGGDLYLGGRNADGEAWSVGIRHPRADGRLIDVLRVSDKAVCTSGDYEKRSDDAHHILDPATRMSADRAASATVVADTAMLADAVATAAFVLGPSAGVELCESLGVEALIIDGNLTRHETDGLRDE